MIDLKGVVGERTYEVGAFIRNPLPALIEHPYVSQIISSRLALFSDLLGVDSQRLKEWSYVQAILAACWAIEEGSSPDLWVRIAEVIEGV